MYKEHGLFVVTSGQDKGKSYIERQGENMKAELTVLNAKKEKFFAQYKTERSEAQEYEIIKQNVDTLLNEKPVRKLQKER